MSENLAIIRVVIIDDHPLFREGVVSTLRASDEFEVVGEGASADDAVRLAKQLLPDIMLLDIAMPGGGIRAAAAIADCCPLVRTVMLTVSEAEDDVLAALRAGARGYILKGVGGGELKRILRAVQRGESFVTPGLAAGVLLELAGGSPRTSENPLDELTERERQILELVAVGMTNRAIGERLGITEKTVKHYMSNILEKLQVRNRVEAALLAHKLRRES